MAAPQRISQVTVQTPPAAAGSAGSTNLRPTGSTLLSAFTSFAAVDHTTENNSASALYDEDDVDLPALWQDILQRAFKPDLATEYSKQLSHHMIDLHLFLTLSNEDLNHMGIRIGHRKRFRKIVSDAIAARERRATMSPTRKAPSPSQQRALRGSSSSATSTVEDDPLYKIRNTKACFNPLREITWLRISGAWPSLDGFLADMRRLRDGKNFPQSFDRLFYDDKPMPFLVLDGSETMLGLLLRIPDLTDQFGTSVASITNRLVFLANLDTGFLCTFHNCAVNPLQSFEEDWDKGVFVTKSVPQLLDSAMRRALKSYSTGVYQLREEMDEFMNEDYSGSEVDRVQGLTRIQKKAGVYKRCAEASRDAIEQMEALESMRPFLRTLADGLSTVESMSEEVQSNALSSIDLTIAISEFKGSFNLKIFTYMTILLQPVSVATSWYGMNWANMPELLEEDGYYIFIGTVWGGAILIFAAIVYGPDIFTWVENYFLRKQHRAVLTEKKEKDDENEQSALDVGNVAKGGDRKQTNEAEEENELRMLESSILNPMRISARNGDGNSVSRQASNQPMLKIIPSIGQSGEHGDADQDIDKVEAFS